MNFAGLESCIHYLDKSLFKSTVYLIENLTNHELVAEEETYNNN